MDKIELRIELIKKGKTARWLAEQLGYSTQYMYYCILTKKQSEIERIKKILGISETKMLSELTTEDLGQIAKMLRGK